MTASTPLIRIKTDNAPKSGPNSNGCITYAIHKDVDSKEAFISIVANESGGYFNRELVPLDKVLTSLEHLPPEATFPTRIFRAAFQGKSVNNGGFLSAILRHEGLIAPAANASHHYVRTGDWLAWRDATLASSGEPEDAAVAASASPVVAKPKSETKAAKRAKHGKADVPPPAAPEETNDGDHDAPAS